MGNLKLSKVEREVLISYNAAENHAELYTADPVLIRRMDALVQENPEQFKGRIHGTYNGEVCAMVYTFPKRFITIRTKDRSQNVSDEQRQKARERMKQYNALKHTK